MVGFVEKYVKKFGYGFIRSENKLIFLSYLDIQTDGHKEVKVGDQVEFDVVKERKGLRAIKVKIL